MTTQEELRKYAEDLGERSWDVPAIQARYEKLAAEGIPRKKLDKQALLVDKQQILDRVQQRAEEYNLLPRTVPRVRPLP